MRKLTVAAASCGLLSTAAVFALGMGDIKMSSRLNQPLNADIELTALRGVPPEDIRVTMAANSEFEKAGIDRSYALNDVKFSVEGNGDNAVVHVRTKDGVRDPFLNFIIEVNWPNGRLLREYTVLLDPPAFSDDVAAAPAVKSNGVAANGKVSSGAVSMPDASMAGASTYGPTTASETLWAIAGKVRPGNATVHQTLVAIFKANPQAFVNNDPNQLQVGQVLRIPSADEIAKIPARKAMAELSGGRSAVVETRSSRSSTVASATSSGRVVLAAPPEKFADTPKSSAASREAAEVLNQENAQLRGELSKLEKKTEQMEKLLQLKDEQLAALQTKAPAPVSTAPVTPTPAPVVAAPTPAPVTPAATTSTPETSADTTSDTTNSEAPADATGTDATVAETAKPEVEQPAAPVNVPKEEPEAGFFSGYLLWIMIALGAILALVGVMIHNKRKLAEENFQDTLLPPEQSSDSNMPMNDDFDLPEVGDDILASPMGAVPSSSSGVAADPLGEADIYIAYGKFDQAENLLLQSIQDQPERNDLRLKLLECYAEKHDGEKFRDQLAEMQNDVDNDPVLAQAVDQLQQRAWPEDDLMGSDIPSADDVFGAVGVGRHSTPTPVKTPVPEPSDDEPSTSASWRPTRKQDPVAPKETDSFDLDLQHNEFAGFGEDSHEVKAAVPTFEMEKEPSQPAAAIPEEEEFGFSLGDDADVPAASWDADLKETHTPKNEFSLDQMEADLPSGDELGMGDIDEIATKLDLARAYIEMHETEGAREILQEVLAEGSEQQKREAETLLSRL